MGVEQKYAKNGNGNRKSTRDDGNGKSYFFKCAKIPIDRLDANFRFCMEDTMTEFLTQNV